MRIISVREVISVICPIYNEEMYIENILQFFINSKPEEKELILIDGGSTDDTVKNIEAWVKRHHNISLLHNANKYVPFALNLAIKNSISNSSRPACNPAQIRQLTVCPLA